VHVVRMGDMRNVYGVLFMKLKEREHLRELVVVETIIIINCSLRMWTGFVRFRVGFSGGLL